MGGVRLGIFHLVNPTHVWEVDAVRSVLAGSTFPWLWLGRELHEEVEPVVRIVWADQSQGVTGSYHNRRNEVQLDLREDLTSPTPADVKALRFVLAHELGHLVDDAILTDLSRAALMDLFHASPETYRRDEEELNGEIIEWAHIHKHKEDWFSNNIYYHRHNETFADLFVAAFCPNEWVGRFPRFTHWTTDLEEFRHIILSWRPPMFSDVSEISPHKKDIEDLSAIGVLKGKADGTFGPNEPVSRAQVAAMMARLLDIQAPDWRKGV